MRTIESDPLVGVLSEKFKAAGIKGVLFDLDDTIIYTGEIFRRFMDEYVTYVARTTGIDKDSLSVLLSDINDMEYRRSGVSPMRWDSVVGALAEIYPEQSMTIKAGLPILKLIYRTEPRVRPGALTSLEAIGAAGIKMGLVTHANEDWTNWKMDQLSLWRFFQAIVIADESKSKTSEHWLRGSEILGLSPEECLVVGDNLIGDIQSATSLGMRAAWMPSPWSVYREGQLPEKTLVIEEIKDLLEVSLEPTDSGHCLR